MVQRCWVKHHLDQRPIYGDINEHTCNHTYQCTPIPVCIQKTTCTCSSGLDMLWLLHQLLVVHWNMSRFVFEHIAGMSKHLVRTIGFNHHVKCIPSNVNQHMSQNNSTIHIRDMCTISVRVVHTCVCVHVIKLMT